MEKTIANTADDSKLELTLRKNEQQEQNEILLKIRPNQVLNEYCKQRIEKKKAKYANICMSGSNRH